MKHSIPIVALFAAFTTPIALAQSCGPVTVGAAGGANCTTPNLQDAINKATNDALCFDNEVWISDSIDGAFFDGGKISINGKEVAIVGGYTSSSNNGCEDLVRTGRTAISGAGGVRASVFDIRGNSTVVLKHLDISGGDPNLGDYGGGIDFDGTGTLVLNESSVNNNNAERGGGIYAKGNISVYFEKGVSISSNGATNGGGVYLDGAGLSWDGEDGEMWLNLASGDGGGIYATGNARVDVFTRGRVFQPGQYFASIYANQAKRGGALALVDKSEARYSSFDGDNPLALAFNSAVDLGGAVYMGSTPSGHNDFCAADAAFINNTAKRGAVAYAVVGFTRLGWDTCALPARPVCRGNKPCISVTGNTASIGAVIDSEFANINVGRTIATGNSGSALVYVGDSVPPYTAGLRTSLVAQNTFSGSVINANDVRVFHSTIADNTLSGPSVFVRRGSRTNVTSIQRSIVWQPGQLMLNNLTNLQVGNIYENVSNDPSILQNHENNRITNPQFVAGYKLRPSSPAVDSATALTSGEVDLEGYPRPVDLPTVPNNGPSGADAGAFELQSGVLENQLFRSGFEVTL